MQRLITTDMLKKNAAAALDSGMLAADVNEKYPSLRLKARYFQAGDGGAICCCAIGASLTPAEAAFETGSNGSCSVLGLVTHGRVAFEDKEWARKFQDAHDSWLQGIEQHNRLLHKATFFEMLGRVMPEANGLLKDLHALFERPGALSIIAKHTQLGSDVVAEFARRIESVVYNIKN